MSKLVLLAVGIGAVAIFVIASRSAEAHQNGCHRWHSCPSDTGSYECGDLGYYNYCGTEEEEVISDPVPEPEPAPITTPTPSSQVPLRTPNTVLPASTQDKPRSEDHTGMYILGAIALGGGALVANELRNKR